MTKKIKKDSHGGARTGAGRPKDERDLEKMEVQIGKDMKQRLREEAKEKGISVSELMRQIVAFHFWLTFGYNHSTKPK